MKNLRNIKKDVHFFTLKLVVFSNNNNIFSKNNISFSFYRYPKLAIVLAINIIIAIAIVIFITKTRYQPSYNHLY